MPSFNKVILVGNVTRDVQVKYTAGGTAVCEVGLAVNRTWFDKSSNSKKEDVTFVDCTLWGRTAEVAGEYLQKGKPCLIEGRLQLDQWEKDGQKHSKLKVIGESLHLLGSRKDSADQTPSSYDGEQSQDMPTAEQAANGFDGTRESEPTDAVPF